MPIYNTKPCEIEAIKWSGTNLEEIKTFVGDALIYSIIDTAWEVGKGRPYVLMKIKTLEGDMYADDEDYIIKGVRGEFYPCKPDIFEKKIGDGSWVIKCRTSATENASNCKYTILVVNKDDKQKVTTNANRM